MTERRSVTGADNPNWRGGRSVTPAGYVLIRLPGHPAADVRGYVYEHRLVMEHMLGRRLHLGERVRHEDNDPGNNDPVNLRLVNPLNRTELVICLCGCGTEMTRLDAAGRPRRFVSGHNSVRGCRAGARPKREQGAGIPEDVRSDLLERFDGMCAYGCGRPSTSWDHVIPWTQGGSFTMPGNTVLACRRCNQAKGCGDVESMWQWIERGIRSVHSDVWVDIISLALSWGYLECPDDEPVIPAAVIL